MQPKSIFASKTFWFNTITGIVAVVGTLTHSFQFTGHVAEIFTGILSVGNIILRFLTTQPIAAGTSVK